MDPTGSKPHQQGHHDLMESDFLKNSDENFGHTLHKGFENFPKSDNLMHDDFEHVEHEFSSGPPKTVDHDDFLSSTVPQHQQQHKSNPSVGGFDDFGIHSSSNLHNFDSAFRENIRETDDLMKGISSGLVDDKKFDDMFTTASKKYTDDLLNFERSDGGHLPPPPVSQNKFSEPVAVPTPPPSSTTNKTSTKHNEFDIEDDYLNPYATTIKSQHDTKDKFISSDDLIQPMGFSSKPAEPVAAPKSTYMGYDDDEIIKNFDQGPSSINLMETEAMIHDVKPAFKEEEHIRKPDTPEPVKSITPEPTPIINPVKPPTPEPVVVKPVPIPEPVVQPTKPVAKPTVVEAPVKPKPVARTSNKMTAAEEMFCSLGLDAWFKPERLHPKVESLIYWRDPKKSGAVFGAGLALLIAMSCFSLISVFAYVSLIVLAGTVAFRIYKNILQAVQKTSEGHPFKEYLEFDLSLSQDKVQQIATVGVAHINAFVAELRRLFLVEDLVDSIKFGLLLWVLTYMGAWFNGMTLVIIAFVALFTLPKVYENNKQSIDTYLDLVRSKILEITDKVKAAIPIGKKAETEKDK